MRPKQEGIQSCALSVYVLSVIIELMIPRGTQTSNCKSTTDGGCCRYSAIFVYIFCYKDAIFYSNSFWQSSVNFYHVFLSRALSYPREIDGACLQMRLSYAPAAHIFLFLVQWFDCQLAGALGLLRILVSMVSPCLLYLHIVALLFYLYLVSGAC